MVTLCFCWSRLNGSSLISDLSFKSYFLWRELRGLGHVQLMWTARFTDVSPFFRVSGVYYSQVIKTKVVERPCCTAVWLVKTSSCKESGVLESRGCGGTLIPTSLWHCFNCSQLETHHSCSPPAVVTWPGCSAEWSPGGDACRINIWKLMTKFR